MKPAAVVFRSRWVAGGAERYLFDIGAALADSLDVRYAAIGEKPTDQVLELLGRRELTEAFDSWPADAREIERRVRPFDHFVNAASGLLLAGRSRRNWLVVFSPGPPEGRVWPRLRRNATRILCRTLRSGLLPSRVASRVNRRYALHPDGSVAGNLRTYDRVIAISRYVSEAVRRRWGVDSEVLYPGIDTTRFLSGSRRANAILSVGRFAPYGNEKLHAVMIDAFRVVNATRPNWTLHLVGGLEDSPLCRRYLSALRERAAGLPVAFHPNLDEPSLRSLYSACELYWHAAGMGVDPIREPDKVEQFGITVVEAMAAGTIPLVFGVGGVLETVEHGRSGYHWRTVDELIATTAALLVSAELRQAIRWRAVRRSRDFELALLGDRVRAWTETSE